jgi:hypothetical protein
MLIINMASLPSVTLRNYLLGTPQHQLRCDLHAYAESHPDESLSPELAERIKTTPFRPIAELIEEYSEQHPRPDRLRDILDDVSPYCEYGVNDDQLGRLYGLDTSREHHLTSDDIAHWIQEGMTRVRDGPIVDQDKAERLATLFVGAFTIDDGPLDIDPRNGTSVPGLYFFRHLVMRFDHLSADFIGVLLEVFLDILKTRHCGMSSWFPDSSIQLHKKDFHGMFGSCMFWSEQKYHTDPHDMFLTYYSDYHLVPFEAFTSIHFPKTEWRLREIGFLHSSRGMIASNTRLTYRRLRERQYVRISEIGPEEYFKEFFTAKDTSTRIFLSHFASQRKGTDLVPSVHFSQECTRPIIRDTETIPAVRMLYDLLECYSLDKYASIEPSELVRLLFCSIGISRKDVSIGWLIQTIFRLDHSKVTEVVIGLLLRMVPIPTGEERRTMQMLVDEYNLEEFGISITKHHVYKPSDAPNRAIKFQSLTWLDPNKRDTMRGRAFHQHVPRMTRLGLIVALHRRGFIELPPKQFLDYLENPS